MSYQVGLSASEDDLEVQGEIDFDFFDDNDPSSNESTDHQDKSDRNEIASKATDVVTTTTSVVNNSSPVVNASVDHNNGATRKTTVETVIPSPECYTGNNCGGSSPGHRSFSYSPSVTGEETVTDSKDSLSDSDASSSLSASESDISTSLTEESLKKSDGEETDSMTDVTPLPSQCSSPLIKSCDNPDNAKDLAFEKDATQAPIGMPDSKCQKKEGVKFLETVKSRSVGNKEPFDVNKLLNTIKTLEVKPSMPKSKVNSAPFLTANNKHRKNLTFTNEDVRRIDHENQRLLKRILVQQNRTRPHFAAVYSRPASSAVNRQKQQRQIELDNLALLKRLEATKPTRDLSRSQLLNEYENRSSVSSRASIRSTSRTSSQLSSCRSSALSRSSAMSHCSINKSLKQHSNLSVKTRSIASQKS